MFERFNDRARQAIILAQEEARMLNHNYIGTEHILLGLIQEGGGVAAKALDSLNISLQDVNDQVQEMIGKGGTRPTERIPFTPRSKMSLELSAREANALGHNEIGTGHILLGLIREGEGVAAQVLQRLGADLTRVEDRVFEVLTDEPQLDVLRGQDTQDQRAASSERPAQDALDALNEDGATVRLGGDTTIGESPQDVTHDPDTDRFFSGFRADATPVIGPDSPDLLAADRLDIAPHVRALALLMTSVHLTPPLAVGLFGDWGSGKTYFVRALQQEVERLRADAAARSDRGTELEVYEEVVQIEFNAWHYVDTDLWASLADAIFDGLIGRVRGSDMREQLERELGRHGAALRRAEGRRAQLERGVANAHDRLESIRLEHAQSLAARDAIAAGVRAGSTQIDRLRSQLDGTDLAQLMDRVTAANDEAKVALGAALEAKKAVERDGPVMNLLRGRFGLARMAMSVAVLVAVPVLSFAIAAADGDVATQLLRGVATLITGLGAVAGLSARGGHAVLGTLREVINDLTATIESDEKVHAARERTKQLEEELNDALANELDARQDLEKVERSLEQFGEDRAGERLHDFIVSRSESDDYRSQLGVASTIRRDFEALSELIEAYNRRERGLPPVDASKGDRALSSSETLQEHLVNRIVLYIDDLDRCPPDKVIQVLQAVHLLLAFPLFVVVVAVDARWLSESLRHHYQELLGGSGSATPHDYLEKILQIPFWLRPMPVDHTKSMIDALTVAENPQQPETEPSTREERPAKPTTDPTAPRRPETTTSASPGESGDGRGEEDVPGPQPVELAVRAIRITEAERAAMKGPLSALLSRSPRSLNRFVNVYRLIKAVHVEWVDSEELAEEQLVTLVLLAIVTGLPSASPRVFAELRLVTEEPATGDGRATKGTNRTAAAVVSRALEKARRRVDSVGGAEAAAQATDRPDQPQRPSARPGDRAAVIELERLDAWLKTNAEWGARQVSGWGEVIAQISRYSYRLERA